MLPEKNIKEIKFEIEEIDNLLKQYHELFNLNREPNLIELTSIASVLHSFYTGIEKIFLIISKKVDKSNNEGNTWHKDLLNAMSKKNKIRDKVISNELLDELSQYLVFRHFFRHAYSFHLKFSEIENLVISIFETWGRFKEEINENLITK